MILFSPYKFDALFAFAADADDLSQLNYREFRRDGSVMEAPVLTDESRNSYHQCISAANDKPVARLLHCLLAVSRAYMVSDAGFPPIFLPTASVKAKLRY